MVGGPLCLSIPPSPCEGPSAPTFARKTLRQGARGANLAQGSTKGVRLELPAAMADEDAYDAEAELANYLEAMDALAGPRDEELDARGVRGAPVRIY